MDSKIMTSMVKPTLGLDVQSWSYDKFLASSASHDLRDGAKVTLLEMHPIRHWILSCDKDGEIFLWDYNSNKLLMRKTLNDIYSTIGREDFAADTVSSTDMRGVRNSKSPCPSSGSSSSVPRFSNGVNDEIARRAQINRSKGYAPSSISQLILKQSAMICDNRQQYSNTTNNYSNDYTSAGGKRTKDGKQSLGEIRQICFADRLAVAHLSGAAIEADDDTFNSDSRVMITCDSAVILYDFALDSAVAISGDKSDVSKIPKCATFIFKDYCAVGFGDGQIRLWGFYSRCLNGPRSKQIKVLMGHQKEIVLLKVLQVPDLSSSGEERCQTVRLLSVCLDGVALIWDFPVLDGELDLRHLNSSSSPAAKLQESVGPLIYGSSGSGAGSLMLLEAFMDCDTHTLVTVAADRSFKLWDMGVLHYQERRGSATQVARDAGIASSLTAHTGRDHSRSFFRATSPRKSKDKEKSSKGRNALPGVCVISCVGRIAHMTSLPPTIAKFVSCAALHHPRYPFGTYAIVSKTNSIGFVQSVDGSQALENDRSSIASSGERPQRFTVLSEVSLGVLMHSYLSQQSSPTLPATHSALLTLAALDGAAKIYCVSAHPTQPHLLAIGTSIGSMILNLLPSQSGPYIGTHPSWGKISFSYSDRFIRKAVVDMVTDSSSRNLSDSLHTRSTSTDGMSKNKDEKFDIGDLIEAIYVDVDVVDEYPILGGSDSVPNSPSLKGSSVLGTSSKSSVSREKEGLQRKRSLTGMMMGFGGKKDGVESVGSASTASSSVSALGASGATLKGFVEVDGMQYPVDSGEHTSLSSAPAVAAASAPVNVTSSRPLFYPSPSGTHCAVFWPESSYYMVFSVKVETGSRFRRHPSAESSSSRRGSGRPRRTSMQRIIEFDGEEDLDVKFSVRPEEDRGDESFTEVDKGRCLSFAWIGTNRTYAILTPGLRSEISANRRSSIGAIFSRAEKERGHYLPPRMVFKVLPVGTIDTAVPILVDSSTLGDAASSGAPQEIFGGLLLCVSTPIRTGKADGNLSGGQKAVSKIEADAIAQQQIEMKKEQLEKDKGKDIGGKKSKTSSASIESIVSASALALEDSVGGGGEHYRASQRSRFYVLSSAVKAKKSDPASTLPSKNLSLQAVSPYMTGVRSVTWDMTTGLCAVLIGLTVNILRLEVTSEGQGQGPVQDSEGQSTEWGKQSSVILSVIASVDLQAYTCTATSLSFSSSYLYPVTFSWQNGQLFALTSTEMLLICTEYPYLAASSSRKSAVSKGERGKGKEVHEVASSSAARTEPSVDVVILASSAADALYPARSKNLNTYVDGTNLTSYQPSSASLDNDPQRHGSYPGSRVLKLKRNTGWLDVIGGRKGHVLLSSRDGTVTSVSLTANPVAAIGSLLSFGPSFLPLVVPWCSLSLSLSLGTAHTACRMLSARGLLGDVITMTHAEADIEKGLDLRVTQDGDDRGGREVLWSDQVLWDAVARNTLSTEIEDSVLRNLDPIPTGVRLRD